LWGSNCDHPYQVQHQSPLNQLTIGPSHFYQIKFTLLFF
jgi:hypothetical protein